MGYIFVPWSILWSPVAARSKAWIYGRSHAGIAGSNPAWGDKCLSLSNVVCCQLEASAMAL